MTFKEMLLRRLEYNEWSKWEKSEDCGACGARGKTRVKRESGSMGKVYLSMEREYLYDCGRHIVHQYFNRAIENIMRLKECPHSIKTKGLK